MASKTQIKRFKFDRLQIESQLTRFSEYLDSCDPLMTNKIEINERYEKCQPLWDSFNKIQLEIEFNEPSVETQQSRIDFEEKYFEVVCKFKELLKESNSNNPSINLGPQSVSSPVKLQPLNLPVFEGSYSHWKSFYDTFLALIHNNSLISNVQKFHYLLSCLKGEAAQAIQSIEITDLNYEIAFKILRERYDNEKLIVQSHLKSLFDIAPMNKTSHIELRKFLDTIQKNVRALNMLKEPVQHWDTILLYLFNTKLDTNTKREWETYSITNKTVKYEDFTKFLTVRCQVLESLDSSKIDNKPEYKNKSTINENSFNNKYDKNRFTKSNNFSQSFVASQNKQCQICNNGIHPVYHCSKFLSYNEQQRLNEIKKLHLCLNCFKNTHITQCPIGGCKKCGKPHNTLLHIEYFKTYQSQANTNNNQNTNTNQNANNNQNLSNNNQTINNNSSQHANKITQNNNTQQNINNDQSSNNNASTSFNAQTVNLPIINALSAKYESEVLLSTAKVLITNNSGNHIEARALLDSASQSNFMSEELVTKLNLNCKEHHVSVCGINTSITKSNKIVTAKIHSKINNYSTNLQFYVLNQITGLLPTSPVDNNKIKIPSNIQLADDDFYFPGKIDLLLGAEIFFELLSQGQIKLPENAPILQNTKLGWVISGNVFTNKQKQKQHQIYCNFTSEIQLDAQIRKFWEIDELPLKRLFSKEEQECEDLFQNTTSHASESKNIAIRRFNKLENKLNSNNQIKEQYIQFMNEYEKLGHMSEIPTNEINIENKPVYYLPHHPVIKESSLTTKLRVVFDASAKTENNISLNDKLKCGPVIQEDLYSILIRFRNHTVVIGADIEKMYRQVWIKDEQRDLQRIVWRTNSDHPLKHYRLNTVTYGTTSASFLAIRSLHECANENSKYSDACEEIKRNFYVDDLLTGRNTIEEAIELKNQISEILERRGFCLRKWVSNIKSIFNETNNAELYVIDESVTKTLGLHWNIKQDSLQYVIKMESNLKPTKRNILSIVSKLFDPLGLMGPIVITAKIILQRIWSENLEWDEEISGDLLKTWIEFYNSWPQLNNIHIQRQVTLPNLTKIQLHGFSDASERAYGAAIYVRSINNENKIIAKLLCAKSKVAPIKTITLPKLELCGALLLSKLMKKTISALHIEIEKVEFWTDSTIVLAWLSEEPINWNVFVSHRVAEIQKNSDINDWNYIKSSENPADILSRGCEPKRLINNELWWQGPKWLSEKRERWPNNKKQTNELDVIPERKINKPIALVSKLPEQDIFTKYSSLNKLQRVIAYCFRFYQNISSNKLNKTKGELTVDELEQSILKLAKLAQAKEFEAEINALKSNKAIAHNSKIISLNPFLDNQGVLRVGGRIDKSSLSFSQKHPAILSKNHDFSKLLIMNEHKKYLHMGPQSLLYNIRLKFWIIGGINNIKKILRTCITCFRSKPKVLDTLMGDLPEQRLTPAKPFFNCGVDYAGPFLIKSSKIRNSKILKAYLCIFICFVTKAVHLELVSDLSTDSFLNALKRFIARRGKVQNMYSDCGSNFIGANNEMQEFKSLLQNQNFQNKVVIYLSQDGIKWNFIPPRSPHFGGLWEANVKQVKYYLKRIVGNASLTFEELTTVFTQIEACLNSRPLSPMSIDPSDLNPLTPGHFLVGDSLVAIPEPSVKDINCNRLNRYQHLKQIVQQFWNRWYKECINQLNKRSKWQFAKDNLNVGDMVILKDDNLPPLKWLLGRVERLFYGTDRIVRVVQVRTKQGSFKRAITKLCLLPLDRQ